MTQNVGFQMADAEWKMQALQEELQKTLAISESMYQDLLSSEERLSLARRQLESSGAALERLEEAAQGSFERLLQGGHETVQRLAAAQGRLSEAAQECSEPARKYAEARQEFIDTAQRHETVSKRVEAIKERLQVMRECSDVLAWISPHDFLGKQRIVFSKFHEDTCQWLFSSQIFEEWLNGQRNSTLWCPGHAGSGKSVLISAAVCYVEERLEGPTYARAMVYCDYKDPTTLSATSIWSSITKQLVEACPVIPAEVRAFRGKHIKEKSLPTAEGHAALVQALTESFDRTFIFVDALDECPEENRESFLRSALKLEPYVRLLITSRSNLMLEEAGFASLNRVDVSAHSSDIEGYLTSVLDRGTRMRSFIAKDPALKQDIVEKLVKNAGGNFLLAHLQIEQLCTQISVKKVRQALDTLPKNVNEFYKDALKRIENRDDEEKTLAKKALSFVFHSKRPLNLSELLHALSVKPDDTEFDDMALTLKQTLLSATAGLIRIDASQTTELIHHTLYEFLEEHQSSLLEPELGLAQACLRYLSYDAFSSGPCNTKEQLDQRLDKYPFFSYASEYWSYHLSSTTEPEALEAAVELLQEEKKLASSLQILHKPRHRTDEWYEWFPRRFTSLHAISYWGLPSLFPALHKEREHINSQDSFGMTPLLLSLQRGHFPTARLLVTEGADLDIQNEQGETPLIWAARKGLTSLVDFLLAEGADPMTEDHEGWIPLYWALIGQHADAVKLLLDHYTTLSTEDTPKNKALILAAEMGNEKAISVLIEHGIEIDWRDELGSTALHWAVPNGHEAATATLLNGGADATSKDCYNNSPLHWAIHFEEITRLLLQHGALPNALNDKQQTPLHWSAHAGQRGVTELLLQYGAAIDAQDSNSITPLHAAALQGHINVVELLLKRGADVNIRDSHQWTPLHAALVRQNHTVVDILTHQTDDGQFIVDEIWARLKNANSRASMEEKAEAKACGSTFVSGLRSAVNSNHVSRVMALLEDGADIDAVDEVGGSTALTLAAWQGRDHLVEFLLEQGADPNRRERNGRMALHIAAERGYQDCVILLVEGGADIDAVIHGWTPMLLACQLPSHSYIPTYLVNRGANVRVADHNGRTALHWAAQHGWRGFASLLLGKGADIDAPDQWGKTPRQYATENREQAVVILFEAFIAHQTM